ncbi:MAG: polyphosphate kinase 2 [Candidatus Marinimicrobia bacterium]|jgi:polyphosphate kinase 2|nr:polyphosphate kinase 2 [Candidatus Neomarinimicrobiota bacterium]MBT3632422.1 polyphosphate kinase 2 [Candidatus Neomarinimicrobiota bacterium]MBT3824853.1 polyphosphate kinase 2 [Candidatus Neomarinimicrobiota bacterium]MBT4132206.1 polyphosphate kinase 2 [Candidatus Neomarinimicrobiota bacterium]MBT4294305.1 polyphosphate kinase 2 [Candidatus Neomarinimicrobiota bacterium]
MTQEENIEQKDQGIVSDPKPQHTIRSVISKAEKKIDPTSGKAGMDEIKDVLKKKQKERIVNAALGKYQQNEELKPYQAELIKLQQHIERVGKKMIILFDGRDASGKGGTIRRLTRYMNEKRYRVEVPGKPSHRQQTELHLKRYIERFPSVGEIVLFDRSWYNRALVEPVMGFCTEKQYREFLDTVNSYENNFIHDSKTTLLKLYFSVSKEEQNRRFERRMNDPLRQWKLSEVDLQAQDLWDEFTAKKFKLLQKTNSKEAPWYIIRSDSKHSARLETMKLILNSMPYRGRSRSLDFQPNDDVVISGDRELKLMERQRRRHGRFIG